MSGTLHLFDIYFDCILLYTFLSTDQWHQTGGVLLMGYEMYRLLSSKKPHLQKQPKSRKKGSQIIDVEEEDRDKNLLVGG